MAESRCRDLKIGTTLATMVRIPWRGIPDPMIITYIPYSVMRITGDMSAKGFGYPVASWAWNVMMQHQLYALLELFDNDTDASADVYVCTYKDVKFYRNPATFTTVLYRPVDGSGKSLVSGSLGSYTNVSAQFVHLIEI